MVNSSINNIISSHLFSSSFIHIFYDYTYSAESKRRCFRSNEKYGKILDTISSSGNPYLNTDSYTDIGLLPTDQSDQPNQPNQSNQHVPIFQEYGSNSMKNELKSFLKRQMKGAM